MSDLRVGAKVVICSGPGGGHKSHAQGTLIAVEHEILSPPIRCADGDVTSIETPVIELDTGEQIRGYECWWHYA